jgi:hypothetical protein
MFFSITLFLENKSDSVQWACTSVYGPVLSHLRDSFWDELSLIGHYWDGPWVIGGDFNTIRTRSEKRGLSFNTSNMTKFNNFISNFDLIDFKCTDRKYTWAWGGASSQMACLDRFLVNTQWTDKYPTSCSTCFGKGFSDHSHNVIF